MGRWGEESIHMPNPGSLCGSRQWKWLETPKVPDWGPQGKSHSLTFSSFGDLVYSLQAGSPRGSLLACSASDLPTYSVAIAAIYIQVLAGSALLCFSTAHSHR